MSRRGCASSMPARSMRRCWRSRASSGSASPTRRPKRSPPTNSFRRWGRASSRSRRARTTRRRASLLAAIDHADSMTALVTERAFLAVLDGSCRTPIAGHATIANGRISFRGLIAKPDGSVCLDVAREGAIGRCRRARRRCRRRAEAPRRPRFLRAGLSHAHPRHPTRARWRAHGGEAARARLRGDAGAVAAGRDRRRRSRRRRGMRSR